MTVEGDARLRKAAVGAALVFAAPVSVASWVLAPASMVEGAEFVSEIESIGRGQMVAALVTGAMFFPAAVIGVLGLMHLLKGRASWVATVGGGLAIAGFTVNAAALGAAGTLAEVVYSDLDTARRAALVEATINGETGLIMLSGPLLAAIGTTILAARLFLAQVLPRASAVLLAVYGPLQLAGFGTESVALITASFAVMTLALVPTGLALLGGGVDEWEHPPTYRGFRKVRGTAEAGAA